MFIVVKQLNSNTPLRNTSYMSQEVLFLGAKNSISFRICEHSERSVKCNLAPSETVFVF